MAVREQQPPLRVVRAFPVAGGTVLVHLHNVSGGVLGGDRLELVVDVGPHARGQITSTGATRVYRARAGLPVAVQRTIVSVAEGGMVEYLPDPIIPFAGSRYRQETRIALAPGAGLFWWEIVAPGRVAHAELFAYELLDLRLEIAAEGRIVALERMKLEPHLRPLSSPARLGSFLYYASFYICRVGVDAGVWRALEAQLGVMAQDLTCSGDQLWGVSTLPMHGLVVRALGCSGREIGPGLLSIWQAAKLELYGQQAVPPRKLY